MLNSNFYKTLGLAYLAKKVSFGDTAIDMVRSHKAKVVFIASDLAANGRKKVTDKCDYYKVKCIEVDDSEILSAAFKKTIVKIVSVNDTGFYSSLMKYIEEGGK